MLLDERATPGPNGIGSQPTGIGQMAVDESLLAQPELLIRSDTGMLAATAGAGVTCGARWPEPTGGHRGGGRGRSAAHDRGRRCWWIGGCR